MTLAFGLGPTEIWVILGIALLLFGAKKLPELARAAGSSISQFKKGLKEPTEAGRLDEPGGGERRGGRSDRDDGEPR